MIKATPPCRGVTKPSIRGAAPVKLVAVGVPLGSRSGVFDVAEHLDVDAPEWQGGVEGVIAFPALGVFGYRLRLPFSTVLPSAGAVEVAFREEPGGCVRRSYSNEGHASNHCGSSKNGHEEIFQFHKKPFTLIDVLLK